MPDTNLADRSQTEEAQRLLNLAIQRIQTHGYQQSSLRTIAAELGTSHRMLIYYFGSADGFLEALLTNLRNRQLADMAMLAKGGKLPSLEQVWSYMSSPEQTTFFRLMYQIYGHALTTPDRHKSLLNVLSEEWLKSLTESLQAHTQASPQKVRAFARLQLAVVRGLMLDLLSTGDRKGVNQALTLFSDKLPKLT